jgi:hypothetical protein
MTRPYPAEQTFHADVRLMTRADIPAVSALPTRVFPGMSPWAVGRLGWPNPAQPPMPVMAA